MWWVAGGCLACNAWRVTLYVTFYFLRYVLFFSVGVLFFSVRFIFFGRRLVLQLPPPPLALTGGVTRLAGQAGAASAWTHHVAESIQKQQLCTECLILCPLC